MTLRRVLARHHRDIVTLLSARRGSAVALFEIPPKALAVPPLHSPASRPLLPSTALERDEAARWPPSKNETLDFTRTARIDALLSRPEGAPCALRAQFSLHLFCWTSIVVVVCFTFVAGLPGFHDTSSFRTIIYLSGYL